MDPTFQLSSDNSPVRQKSKSNSTCGVRGADPMELLKNDPITEKISSQMFPSEMQFETV